MHPDKTRLGAMTDEEMFLVNSLTPKERKEAIIKAAREKMERALQKEKASKEAVKR